jgi:hypothetical protein
MQQPLTYNLGNLVPRRYTEKRLHQQTRHRVMGFCTWHCLHLRCFAMNLIRSIPVETRLVGCGVRFGAWTLA